MCLNPVRLFNPVKKISKVGAQSFNLEVPCGQCAECKETMRTAWYFRTYYHCKEIYNKNGYVYFDTLTYAPKNLPYVDKILKLDNDSLHFPCFDVTHYRRFFLDLRQWMRLNGYGDVKMTYFLTTEYGLNPKDGKTFRPHYHVLFFIDNSNSEKVLHPFALSNIVAKYWKYGRTDGLPYKDKVYVKNHVFGKDWTRDFVHMRSVCNYVSKYVTKDSDFAKVIEDRLKIIYDELYEDNMSYAERKKVNKLYKEAKKCVDQFHRQSHHFGEYMLHDEEVDWKQVLKTGMMSMPDKNIIVKHAPLDGYYIRKVFYDKKKDKDGREYWALNEFGIKYKLERLLKSVDRLDSRFNEIFMNLPFWYGNECDKHMNVIANYLDGRNFRDFAIYLLLYKGKTRFGLLQNNLVGYSQLCPYEDDLGVWMQYVMKDPNEEEDVLYHYSSQSDRERFKGSRFVTDKDLGNKDKGYIDESQRVAGLYDYNNIDDRHYGDFVKRVKSTDTKYYGEVISDRDFVKLYCINENTDYRFRDFDKLYFYMNKLQRKQNELKQECFDFKEKLKKQWSALNKKD